MNQSFSAELHIESECDEKLSEIMVKRWLEDQFNGCDLGKVTIKTVVECKK